MAAMSDTEADLAPIDKANLLAGQAVAYATAYLDGRHSAEQLAANAALQLATNAALLQGDLFAARDPATNGILDPVRLLAIAMLHTARAQDEARRDRWRQIIGALVELVGLESRALRDSKAATEQGR
jgi:hypothetical protein